jgi:hypothetical protein
MHLVTNLTAIKAFELHGKKWWGECNEEFSIKLIKDFGEIFRDWAR